ncbi:hypothetical protein FM106_10405 [Brachybacterium faecium]|nr:hypothetical protein FM106_10405 [Brachybacterium faecium]
MHHLYRTFVLIIHKKTGKYETLCLFPSALFFRLHFENFFLIITNITVKSKIEPFLTIKKTKG